jgi:hypothetical protein
LEGIHWLFFWPSPPPPNPPAPQKKGGCCQRMKQIRQGKVRHPTCFINLSLWQEGKNHGVVLSSYMLVHSTIVMVFLSIPMCLCGECYSSCWSFSYVLVHVVLVMGLLLAPICLLACMMLIMVLLYVAWCLCTQWWSWSCPHLTQISLLSSFVLCACVNGFSYGVVLFSFFLCCWYFPLAFLYM